MWDWQAIGLVLVGNLVVSSLAAFLISQTFGSVHCRPDETTMPAVVSPVRVVKVVATVAAHEQAIRSSVHFLDGIAMCANILIWQHHPPNAPRCMSGSPPAIVARRCRTSCSPCKRQPR